MESEKDCRGIEHAGSSYPISPMLPRRAPTAFFGGTRATRDAQPLSVSFHRMPVEEVTQAQLNAAPNPGEPVLAFEGGVDELASEEQHVGRLVNNISRRIVTGV